MSQEENNSIETKLDAVRDRVDKVESVVRRQRRKHISSRLKNFRLVRASVVTWILLLAVLISTLFIQGAYYAGLIRNSGAVSGGVYSEGVVGEIKTFNPLYATTGDEIAASRLVYSSLFEIGETNTLQPLLAESYSADDNNLVFEVKMRSDVRWQNSDEKVTVDDVIFTLSLIKNSAVGSELYSTWRSVQVEKVDHETLRFRLRTPLASFPNALTFGILSKQELGNIPPAEMREYLADNIARGSGPFIYDKTISSQSQNKILSFKPNKDYFKGASKLEAIHIETFSTANDLAAGFRAGEVNVAVDLPLKTAQEVAKNSNDLIETRLNRGVYAFFNNDSAILKDKEVRKALRLGFNREALLEAVSVGGSAPSSLETPIAREIYSSVDDLKQPDYNLNEAKKMLDVAGWSVGSNGLRQSGDKTLSLRIVTVADSDYEIAAQNIAEQWQELGVKTELILASPEDIQSQYIMPRNYDVLVYQLNLTTDADVYAYWHSSAANAQGLNLSNYKSGVSDSMLLKGRSGIDREISYTAFSKDWLDNTPAIALYQSSYYSLKVPGINNFGTKNLSDKSDRFRDAINFAAKTKPVFKTP